MLEESRLPLAHHIPVASITVFVEHYRTMIIKDIRKWRLRMTSTNFNELVDFGV